MTLTITIEVSAAQLEPLLRYLVAYTDVGGGDLSMAIAIDAAQEWDEAESRALLARMGKTNVRRVAGHELEGV